MKIMKMFLLVFVILFLAECSDDKVTSPKSEGLNPKDYFVESISIHGSHYQYTEYSYLDTIGFDMVLKNQSDLTLHNSLVYIQCLKIRENAEDKILGQVSESIFEWGDPSYFILPNGGTRFVGITVPLTWCAGYPDEEYYWDVNKIIITPVCSEGDGMIWEEVIAWGSGEY